MASRARLDVSDSKIEEVIDLLAADKPITKKRACEILGITYNTARLDTIISDYLDKKARFARRKAEKRGKPLDNSEMKDIIEAVLDKQPIGDLAETLARSVALIKSFIEKSGLPVKDKDCDYRNPPMIGDPLVRSSFSVGQIVYSAQYQQVAEVVKDLGNDAYRIWLSDDMQYACVPVYELADLTVFIKEYGANIKIKTLGTPCSVLIAEALRNSKKLKES